jgi:cell division protein FtsW
MVLIVGQSLINIGVATGSLPTTGLPLPFFSYGINSIIASLLLAGLLIRVAREGAQISASAIQPKARSIHNPPIALN